MYSATVKSYAKINLTLEVLGLKDGFHMLDSFVASLDLCNLVTVKKRKDNLVCGKMKGMGMDSVPFEKTTAYKVADAFRQKFQTTGTEITIYENIPVGAGLGGSSADAAGVLRALCKLYDTPLDKVYDIANQYGSDIRYMLEGGFARMQGKGEVVTPLEEKNQLHFLLLCPNSTVSAGECYKKYDELGGTPSYNTQKAVQAYHGGDLQTLGSLLCNDLFYPAKSLNADLGRAYEELLSFSPLGVCMTGSGSCVFALFESKELCEWAKSRYRGNFRAIVSSTISTVSGGFEKLKNPFAL